MMRSRTPCMLLPLVAAVLGGCSTPTPDQLARRDARQAALVPAAIPAGPAERCIQTQLIRQTHVRNDSVIDFELNGGQVYRNILPIACPGLGFEQRIAYRTTIGQLCSVDTVTVLRSPPGIQGPTCGLGEFQPVRLTAGDRRR